MFRRYTLKPQTVHDDLLEFEWDSAGGVVRGPGTEIILKLCAQAVRDGAVVGHPYPTSFNISDPLHRVSEMAVVLGQFWVLDNELAQAYP